MELPIYYDFDEFKQNLKINNETSSRPLLEILKEYNKHYKLELKAHREYQKSLVKALDNGEDYLAIDCYSEASKMYAYTLIVYKMFPFSFGDTDNERKYNFNLSANKCFLEIKKIKKFINSEINKENIKNIKEEVIANEAKLIFNKLNVVEPPTQSEIQNDDNYLLYSLENSKKALFIFKRWGELYKNKIRTRNADFTFLFYKLTRDPKTKLLKNKSNQNFKTICINNLPELNLEKMRIDGNLRKPTNREDEKRQKDFDKIISDWEDQNKEV